MGTTSIWLKYFMAWLSKCKLKRALITAQTIIVVTIAACPPFSLFQIISKASLSRSTDILDWKAALRMSKTMGSLIQVHSRRERGEALLTTSFGRLLSDSISKCIGRSYSSSVVKKGSSAVYESKTWLILTLGGKMGSCPESYAKLAGSSGPLEPTSLCKFSPWYLSASLSNSLSFLLKRRIMKLLTTAKAATVLRKRIVLKLDIISIAYASVNDCSFSPVNSTINVEPRVSAVRPVKSYLRMNCSFKMTIERKTWTNIARAQLVAKRDIFRKGRQKMWSNMPKVIVLKPRMKRHEQYAPVAVA